jgi:hypothetical protein
MPADLVEDDGVQDHSVEWQGPGVIRDQQRRTIGRKVLGSSNFDAEPGLSEPAQQREIDLGCELGIEPELVDGIVAAQSGTNEGHRFLQRSLPVDTRLLRQGNQAVDRIGSEVAQLGDGH